MIDVIAPIAWHWYAIIGTYGDTLFVAGLGVIGLWSLYVLLTHDPRPADERGGYPDIVVEEADTDD